MPLPDGQTTWATVADVDAVTGATVDETDLTRAQATLDVHAGRTIYSAAAIGDQDLHFLKLALAYQVTWATAQVDQFERMDLTSIPSDAGGNPGITATGMTLAPNARVALSRLSWKRSRSLHTGPLRRAGVPFENELSDIYHGWRPRRGGVS